MTREEAIAILQEEIDGSLELTLREWRERDEQKLFPALRMAIESLSADEVVRCKDCMNYTVEGKTTKFGWCNALELPIDETDFCSHGEGRTQCD